MRFTIMCFVCFNIRNLAFCTGISNSTDFWQQVNGEMTSLKSQVQLSQWKFETSVTEASKKLLIKAMSDFSQRLQYFAKTAKELQGKVHTSVERRQLKLLHTDSNMLSLETESLSDIRGQIIALLSSSCVKCLHSSFDPNNLLGTQKEYFVGESTGINNTNTFRPRCFVQEHQARVLFIDYWNQRKKQVLKRGIGYYDSLLSKIFEVENLTLLSNNIYEQVKPLYMEIQAYIKHRVLSNSLRNVNNNISNNFYAKLWSPNWLPLYEEVQPYPEDPGLGINTKLKDRYDIMGIFMQAESFFTSIGWQKLPPSFWANSIFGRPQNENLFFCLPSALERYGDIRVKTCAEEDENNFFKIHHQLGHIYYYLLYSHQPYLFRMGANLAFHEAIGGLFALDAKSPMHLIRIGLLSYLPTSDESEINFLFKNALEDVVSIPYLYSSEKWISGVLQGVINEEEYNTEWWKLRRQHEGLEPSLAKKNSIFNVTSSFQLLNLHSHARTLLSQVLQYSIYEGLLRKLNCTRAFHCSIRDSYKTGKILRKALALGRSRPWQSILKDLTGNDEVTASPLMRYYDRLHRWLKNERLKSKYPIGWTEKSTNRQCRTQPKSLIILFVTSIMVVIKL